MLEWSVKEFLDRVACADEEPGGGCAAALAGSLAAALTAFVAGLTRDGKSLPLRKKNDITGK